MFTDTITVFNRYESRLGDKWYPSVIHKANVQMDKGAMMAKYGSESKDSVMVAIHYIPDGTERKISGKTYVGPKKWDELPEEELENHITFKNGTAFDFFMLGEYENAGPIADEDYTDGFYNYINQTHDNVFAITSIGLYSVVPHFEILGK